ncbi:protease modulator HflK [Martelella alba]|uniref:Protease modulator HflK n=1 Tax=Martelella alba TaxID=2590451 RepID=A0ABY2SPA1_9HYPH|nr:protease modulator HflK [Martelella alba]TKI07793.1 protease modulator HflK [Martelella alba]
MTGPTMREPGRDGPWLQAGRLAFWALCVVTLLTAGDWLLTNVRQIGPDSQAVVLRFGALNRLRHAGLLLAWPRPFEDVVVLPAADRILERRVVGLLRSTEAQQADYSGGLPNDTLAGSGYLLTGDAGVVQLDVRVFYKINRPYEYVVQKTHVGPALDRLVERAAVVICASRDLDAILVARPELVSNDSAAVQSRERLRGDLRQNINQSLRTLEADGLGLGIEIERVDVQSSLPEKAVSAFNAVLTSSQLAEQAIASAQNDATRQLQTANQAADRTLRIAQAAASERLAKARADTASISSLAHTLATGADPGILWRLYRDRIAAIFAQAGSVTAVDPHEDDHLILQGVDVNDGAKK